MHLKHSKWGAPQITPLWEIRNFRTPQHDKGCTFSYPYLVFFLAGFNLEIYFILGHTILKDFLPYPPFKCWFCSGKIEPRIREEYSKIWKQNREHDAAWLGREGNCKTTFSFVCLFSCSFLTFFILDFDGYYIVRTN